MDGSHLNLIRDHDDHPQRDGRRVVLECRGCARQTSLLAGTVMQHTKLPLRTWFLATFFISQAKTGLSALALKRHLGVSYRTAWLLHHKVMAVMAAADALKKQN